MVSLSLSLKILRCSPVFGAPAKDGGSQPFPPSAPFVLSTSFAVWGKRLMSPKRKGRAFQRDHKVFSDWTSFQKIDDQMSPHC